MRTSPMLVAPFIDGLYHFDSELIPEKINKILTDIGSYTSLSGNFDLGYTLNLPLFRFYKKIEDVWIIDLSELRKRIEIILKIDRSVVIYLSLNHFSDANIDLCKELSQDTRNIMFDANGPMAIQDYFNNPIIPWTISDYSAPITKFRENVFREALNIIRDIYPEIEKKLRGISILGEVHDMFNNFLDGPSYDINFYESSDYSEINIHGFRGWLKQEYVSISDFNKKYNLNFDDFDCVNPPIADAHLRKININEHIDGFSFGLLKFNGWYFDEQNREFVIEVYLDGKFIGLANKALSRTDVSDVMSLPNSNVGFRFILDYVNVSCGPHIVQIIASRCDGSKLEISKIDFSYSGADSYQESENNIFVPDYKPLSIDKKCHGHLDFPKNNIEVFYNPISSLWLKYRNKINRNYIQYFAKIVAEYNFPKKIVFSHQICPSLYGSWNEDIVSTNSSLQVCSDYMPGVTLYGGTAYSEAFEKLKTELNWNNYSVSEMHPMGGGSVHQYLDIFNFHLSLGAIYVAPYYLPMTPSNDEQVDDLSRFEISPYNSRLNSNIFYQSLTMLMRT
jgi:hypothetical protein